MARPRPRVAIVGAGPAGAFAAASLLRASGGVEIDRTFPLAEAAAAHAHIESRRAFGRVVMTP